MSNETARKSFSWSRKTKMTAFLVFLILNLALAYSIFPTNDSPRDASQTNGGVGDMNSQRSTVVDEEEERNRTIFELRTATELQSASNEALIGELVERPSWKRAIEFAPWQNSAILQLDNVIRQAREDAYARDADYVEAGHKGYSSYVDRGHERRKSVRYHGQQVLQLGILNDHQATYVMHACYSKMDVFVALSDPLVQAHLAVTAEQFSQLNRLRDKSVSRKSQLSLMTRDSEERETNRTALINIKMQINKGALEILSPEQLSKWNKLIARKLSPSLPTKIPDFATRKLEVEKNFRLFMYLEENPDEFNLTDRQEQQVRDLKDVVRTGIAALHYREKKLDNDEKPLRKNSVREFLSHAREIILIGILSQEQEQKARRALDMPRNVRGVHTVESTI